MESFSVCVTIATDGSYQKCNAAKAPIFGLHKHIFDSENATTCIPLEACRSMTKLLNMLKLLELCKIEFDEKKGNMFQSSNLWYFEGLILHMKIPPSQNEAHLLNRQFFNTIFYFQQQRRRTIYQRFLQGEGRGVVLGRGTEHKPSGLNKNEKNLSQQFFCK